MSGPRRQNADECVFCEIVEGNAPARFEHIVSDEGTLLNHPELVTFHNRLDWARVMLLIVPRQHMLQADFWVSRLIGDAGALGMDLGKSLCPEGFRLISNFGRVAHQSQEHAHLHVISGAGPPPGMSGAVVAQMGDVMVRRLETPEAPLAAALSLNDAAAQYQLWSDSRFPRVARSAIEYGSDHSPEGFRLSSGFESPASGVAGGGEPGLVLLGGGQLELYM
jgi:histidine triad (HIT) family protein